MNDRDEFTGLEYDTLEDAEFAIKHCPEGWWIDKWFDLYDAWKTQHMLYNLDDITELYD